MQAETRFKLAENVGTIFFVHICLQIMYFCIIYNHVGENVLDKLSVSQQFREPKCPSLCSLGPVNWFCSKKNPFHALTSIPCHHMQSTIQAVRQPIPSYFGPQHIDPAVPTITPVYTIISHLALTVPFNPHQSSPPVHTITFSPHPNRQSIKSHPVHNSTPHSVHTVAFDPHHT